MNKLILQLLFLTVFSLFTAQAQKTWYSSPDGDGNGMNPNNPGELQMMIDNADNGDIILLAKGKYVPHNVIKEGTWHDDNNNSAFLIRKNIKLKGGFDRTYTTAGSAEETILSGENKRFHVVVIAQNSNQEQVAPVLDNLTIQKGGCNATIIDLSFNLGTLLKPLTIEKRRGAGLFIIKAKPQLNNVIIKDNTARSFGGGVYIEDSAPVFTNVVIKYNAAQAETLDIVKENYGGGVYNKNSATLFVNTLIHDNMAANRNGGGVYVDVNLIINAGVTPTFINTTFVNNSSLKGLGGGLCVEGLAKYTLSIKNCIFYNNKSQAPLLPLGGKSNQTHNVNENSFYNSFVQGETYNKIQNNLNGNINPQINLTTFELESGSPLVDMGDNTSNPAKMDLNGNRRISGEKIDLGAKEYQYRYLITEKPATGMEYTCATTQDHTVGYGDSHTVEFTLLGTHKDSIQNIRLVINNDSVKPTINGTKGSYKIENIKNDITVEITGLVATQVTPGANDVVDDNSASVYTNGDLVFVKVSKKSKMAIYSITGKLYANREISAGETSLQLPKGFFIVQIDGKSHKVRIAY